MQGLKIVQKSDLKWTKTLVDLHKSLFRFLKEEVYVLFNLLQILPRMMDSWQCDICEQTLTTRTRLGNHRRNHFRRHNNCFGNINLCDLRQNEENKRKKKAEAAATAEPEIQVVLIIRGQQLACNV